MFMDKEKLREEIENENKWDLTLMYKNDKELEQEIKLLDEYKNKIMSYKGKILDSANNLYEVMKLYYDGSEYARRLMLYASLKYDEDTTNNESQELKGIIENITTKYSEDLSFVIPELLKSDFDLILKYIKENPKLEEYKNTLEKHYRFKKYTLSEKEEKIIASFSLLSGIPYDISGMLSFSDLDYGKVKNDQGEEIDLNGNSYSVLIMSKNREVRKNAFLNLYNTYRKFTNTFTLTLKGDLESTTTVNKLRGYNNSLESSLYKNNIDVKVYDNLIKAVNDRMDVIYKYFKLKKDVLGIEDFSLYDTYVNLVSDFDKKYKYEDGKKLVLEALKVLGEDYITHLNKAFDNRWIDIYYNKGKRVGAYQNECFTSPCYVLLNYNDELNDVFTLAHELGHAMHSLYAKENNTIEDYRYSIFVAEIASTVNELLLANHLLKTSKEKHEKLYILSEQMDRFKATLYRQTMFAEFEKEIYTLHESGSVLTSKLLCDKYYDLVKKYFGDDVICNEEIKYEWERIPHFYYNFYVYQYATGLSIATSIVTSILNGEKDAVKNYLEFLKVGGRIYPQEALKVAGIDITDEKVVNSAIDSFDKIISDFRNLYFGK